MIGLVDKREKLGWEGGREIEMGMRMGEEKNRMRGARQGVD